MFLGALFLSKMPDYLHEACIGGIALGREIEAAQMPHLKMILFSLYLICFHVNETIITSHP